MIKVFHAKSNQIIEENPEKPHSNYTLPGAANDTLITSAHNSL